MISEASSKQSLESLQRPMEFINASQPQKLLGNMALWREAVAFGKQQQPRSSKTLAYEASCR